jgi:hypothetical protein
VALALDVRFAGRELYGGRPRAVASWSREAGDTVLVKTVGRSVARVSVESTWPITARQGPSRTRAVTRVKERPGFQRIAPRSPLSSRATKCR